MTERERTSIHEAGHTCAAMLLKIPNIGGVVFDGGGGVATPTPETAIPPQAEDYTTDVLTRTYADHEADGLLRDAVYVAAGCVAEGLATNPMQHVVVLHCDGAMLDAQAAQAFNGSDPHVSRAWSQLAVARARALLSPVFFRVRAVAEELNRKGRLTAAEVKEAFDSPKYTEV